MKLHDKMQMTSIDESPGCLGWLLMAALVLAVIFGVWLVRGPW